MKIFCKEVIYNIVSRKNLPNINKVLNKTVMLMLRGQRRVECVINMVTNKICLHTDWLHTQFRVVLVSVVAN